MVHGVELPEFYKSALTNSSYTGSSLIANTTTTNTVPSYRRFGGHDSWTAVADEILNQPMKAKPMPDAKPEVSDLRIVKIVIADVDKNLPVASRILFQGEEQVTELTDEELFFEVPIVELLKKHNELRSKTLHKADSAKAGKDVFLEPIRVRDLRMVVVDIADFSN